MKQERIFERRDISESIDSYDKFNKLSYFVNRKNVNGDEKVAVISEEQLKVRIDKLNANLFTDPTGSQMYYDGLDVYLHVIKLKDI